jgi:hypothetical protein
MNAAIRKNRFFALISNGIYVIPDRMIRILLHRLLIIAGLLILQTSVQSQPTTWAKPGAHWYYSEGDVFFYYGYIEIWEEGDTTFANGIVCDILRSHRTGFYFYPGGGPSSQPGPTWYTYQNGDTVFVYYNNQFNILFIDNLLPGQEFITGPDINTSCDGDTIVIDSLYSVNLSGFIMNKIVPVMPDWFNGQWPPGGASIAYHNPFYSRFGSTAYFIPAPNCITDTPYGPLRCYSDSSGFTFSTAVVPACDFVTGTGVEPSNASSPLSLISNPVQDILTIKFSDQFYSPVDEIFLFDSKGEKIFSHPLNKNEFRFDVSNLTAGTYFIKIKNRPLIKPVSFIKL